MDEIFLFFHCYPFRAVQPFELELCDLLMPAELVHDVKNISAPAEFSVLLNMDQGDAADVKNCHPL